jgi:hypothetical protein
MTRTEKTFNFLKENKKGASVEQIRKDAFKNRLTEKQVRKAIENLGIKVFRTSKTVVNKLGNKVGLYKAS